MFSSGGINRLGVGSKVVYSGLTVAVQTRHKEAAQLQRDTVAEHRTTLDIGMEYLRGYTQMTDGYVTLLPTEKKLQLQLLHKCSEQKKMTIYRVNATWNNVLYAQHRDTLGVRYKR